MSLIKVIQNFNCFRKEIKIVHKHLQAKIGRWEEFEIALQRLRGESADISYESNEIKVK